MLYLKVYHKLLSIQALMRPKGPLRREDWVSAMARRLDQFVVIPFPVPLVHWLQTIIVS
jgi:hypothetical protein